VDDGIELRRQVHPSWIQNERVTSQAFRPTPKDNGKLSTYHGGMIQPKEAWEHYTGVLQLESLGVQAVTVQECKEQDVPPNHDKEHYDEHVSVDFTGKNESQARKISAKLRHAAEQRGWQYRA
jgi:hypothetical protein